MRMPAAVTDRVTAYLQRNPSRIADVRGLVHEEPMVPPGREKGKEPTEADVLDTRHPGAPPPCPGPLRQAEAIALDEFPVNDARVLAPGDPAGDIEKVSPADVAYGHLLYEPLKTRRLDPLLHHCRFAGHQTMTSTPATRDVG
jgi:hypothetical protein